MIDESIACSQGLVPLTPRVDIHHQKKTNKKALHSQKIDSFHRESAFSLENICVIEIFVVILRRICNL